MRSRISGGMLAIICCICSDDIPGGIPWGLMPWASIPDASGAESCEVVAFGAAAALSAAAAASFFFDSAASMARITLLLTPAWPSDCSPVEERSNCVSLAAMACHNRGFRQPGFHHLHDVGIGQQDFSAVRSGAVNVRRRAAVTQSALALRMNTLL